MAQETGYRPPEPSSRAGLTTVAGQSLALAVIISLTRYYCSLRAGNSPFQGQEAGCATRLIESRNEEVCRRRNLSPGPTFPASVT
jgi:hypothetical protein